MSARPDRMPPLDTADLTGAQAEAVAAISSGPRGGVFGPFVPLLRSPRLMAKLQDVGAYLRFESELDHAVFEMTILLVARHRDQPFEWNYHSPLALKAGVPEAAVRAISAGRQPEDLPEPLATGYAVVSTVLAENSVPDELYTRAIDTFGEAAFIDLVATVGYYTTLALVMNSAQTDASDMPVQVPLDPR